MMIALVLLLPILLGVWSVIAKNRLVNRIALIGSAVLYFFIAVARLMNIEWYLLPTWLVAYFQFDTIGLYFFSIMTIVFDSAAVYSLFYFKIQTLSAKQEAVYIVEILLFVVAMSGVILSTHLALLWVFIEASTLTSAMLIYFEKKKSSLEAAWKYVFICSIGIALAFVGIIVLSIGSRHIDSLFFKDLYARASDINPFWLKVSFAFIFVGLGTKIGIAPIHAWLPDAHSEAPSPVSALLSGALLNSAFLGLLRVQEIFISARMDDFSNFLFLITGFLSLMVSSVFMLRLKNYKRMLAYSSIENMGILFIGIALGKYGIFAALLQTLAHSLSKASLFLTSGNILHLYKTKKIEEVNSLLTMDPRTGWLWIISMLAIIGFPPFPVFISKFLIVRAFWLSGMFWLAIPFFLFLVVILYGMGSTIFKMTFSNSQTADAANKKLAAYAYVPQLVMLLILCIIGINMPQQLIDLLNGVVGFFQ
jgi:hydrogenase-4 component F